MPLQKKFEESSGPAPHTSRCENCRMLLAERWVVIGDTLGDSRYDVAFCLTCAGLAPTIIPEQRFSTRWKYAAGALIGLVLEHLPDIIRELMK